HAVMERKPEIHKPGLPEAPLRKPELHKPEPRRPGHGISRLERVRNARRPLRDRWDRFVREPPRHSRSLRRAEKWFPERPRRPTPAEELSAYASSINRTRERVWQTPCGIARPGDATGAGAGPCWDTGDAGGLPHLRASATIESVLEKPSRSRLLFGNSETGYDPLIRYTSRHWSDDQARGRAKCADRRFRAVGADARMRR